MSSIVGGFTRGLAQGMKLRSELDDADERRALRKQQAERDTKRFEWETSEQTEKERRRTMLREAEAEYAAADDFLKRGEAPQQAISAPAAGMPAAPRPAAIAAPGAAPQEAQAPKENPFLTGAERFKDPKAAMDQYYAMKESALRKLYVAQGQYDKAEAVPEQMRKLREFQWSEKVGSSLAAMVSNAPYAREALAKVYGVIADGYELDPKSGRFDPKRGGWVDLERVGADGKREKFDLTSDMAFVMANKYKDPAAVIQYLDQRQDKERTFAIQDRQVAADERRAGAAEVSARATADRAAFLNRKDNQDDSRQAQAALVNAVGKLFPLAGKEFKEEELMGKDRQQKLDKKAADEKMMNKTIELAGLNPKVNLTALASIARAGSVNAQKDAEGRVFTMVGNTKVYLQ